MADIDIEVALLKQAMTHRDQQIDDLRKSIEDLSRKIDGISETMSEAKGGWRILMMVGGASGAIGGTLHWIISNITFKMGV